MYVCHRGLADLDRGFAADMLRIRAWTSGGTDDRPIRPRLFQLQNRRKARPCQATTVSGLTMTMAARQPFQTRDSQIHNKRSARASRTRCGRDRFSTCSWCRNVTTSRYNAARERTQLRAVSRSDTRTDIIGEKRIRGGVEHQRWQQVPAFQYPQRHERTNTIGRRRQSADARGTCA